VTFTFTVCRPTLVEDTWETVVANLSDGRPVRLWYIRVEQTNNGATAEDIEECFSKLELEISDDILERMNRTVALIGFKDREELTISALLRLLDRLELS